MDKKTIAVPGEFLTTEEEFMPGKNTFERDGSIYSNSLGEAEFDSKTKEVSVKKKNPVSVLDVGTIVYGEVVISRENRAVISISYAEKDGEKKVITLTSATIPVRNAGRGFIKDMRDCFKIGDFVKAKVALAESFAVDLRTNDPGLGVIKAFCSRCRRPLGLFAGKLKCTSCGNTENRIVSPDYMIK